MVKGMERRRREKERKHKTRGNRSKEDKPKNKATGLRGHSPRYNDSLRRDSLSFGISEVSGTLQYPPLFLLTEICARSRHRLCLHQRQEVVTRFIPRFYYEGPFTSPPEEEAPLSTANKSKSEKVVVEHQQPSGVTRKNFLDDSPVLDPSSAAAMEPGAGWTCDNELDPPEVLTTCEVALYW